MDLSFRISIFRSPFPSRLFVPVFLGPLNPEHGPHGVKQQRQRVGNAP